MYLIHWLRVVFYRMKRIACSIWVLNRKFDRLSVKSILVGKVLFFCLLCINTFIFNNFAIALLFSATFKRPIEELARDILTDPVRVTVGWNVRCFFSSFSLDDSSLQE